MTAQTTCMMDKRTDGWREINEGLISPDTLKEWIQRYFNTKENLSQFKSRNGEQGLELVNQLNSRGYVFVGPLQIEGDFEGRMERIKEWYEAGNRRILKKFVDYKNELSGFSWVGRDR